LKILFITEACSAGVGRHVIDAALCHARAGEEIHLLHALSRLDSRFIQGLEQLNQAGAHVTGLDVSHLPGPKDYSVVKQIRSYLLTRGPFDVLHCHSTKAGLVGRVAALGLGSHVVYTPHAFFTMSPENGFVARVAIQVLELGLSWISTLIICVSEEERDHARKLGIHPNKLCVVPNGIDHDEANEALRRRSEARQSFGLADHDVCIGFVGRLVPQKNPQLLVEAFLRILPGLPGNVRLVIVGDGFLRPALAALISNAMAGDRILLAGQADGLLAMSAFDVFALPSRYEGFPYVVLEALALGLPVVATEVGGVSAMTVDSENGYVVAPADLDGFARALSLLATDPRLRDRMADCSRRHSKRFSLSRMIADTRAVYKPSVPVSQITQPIASRSPKTAITD
jgi:glycosyltransferase involved in cell wall biosynthesis